MTQIENKNLDDDSSSNILKAKIMIIIALTIVLIVSVILVVKFANKNKSKNITSGSSPAPIINTKDTPDDDTEQEPLGIDPTTNGLTHLPNDSHIEIYQESQNEVLKDNISEQPQNQTLNIVDGPETYNEILSKLESDLTDRFNTKIEYLNTVINEKQTQIKNLKNEINHHSYKVDLKVYSLFHNSSNIFNMYAFLLIDIATNNDTIKQHNAELQMKAFAEVCFFIANPEAFLEMKYIVPSNASSLTDSNNNHIVSDIIKKLETFLLDDSNISALNKILNEIHQKLLGFFLRDIYKNYLIHFKDVLSSVFKSKNLKVEYWYKEYEKQNVLFDFTEENNQKLIKLIFNNSIEDSLNNKDEVNFIYDEYIDLSNDTNGLKSKFEEYKDKLNELKTLITSNNEEETNLITQKLEEYLKEKIKKNLVYNSANGDEANFIAYDKKSKVQDLINLSKSDNDDSLKNIANKILSKCVINKEIENMILQELLIAFKTVYNSLLYYYDNNISSIRKHDSAYKIKEHLKNYIEELSVELNTVLEYYVVLDHLQKHISGHTENEQEGKLIGENNTLIKIKENISEVDTLKQDEVKEEEGVQQEEEQQEKVQQEQEEEENKDENKVKDNIEGENEHEVINEGNHKENINGENSKNNYSTKTIEKSSPKLEDKSINEDIQTKLQQLSTMKKEIYRNLLKTHETIIIETATMFKNIIKRKKIGDYEQDVDTENLNSILKWLEFHQRQFSESFFTGIQNIVSVQSEISGK